MRTPDAKALVSENGDFLTDFREPTSTNVAPRMGSASSPTWYVASWTQRPVTFSRWSHLRQTSWTLNMNAVFALPKLFHWRCVRCTSGCIAGSEEPRRHHAGRQQGGDAQRCEWLKVLRSPKSIVVISFPVARGTLVPPRQRDVKGSIVSGSSSEFEDLSAQRIPHEIRVKHRRLCRNWYGRCVLPHVGVGERRVP